MNDQSSPPFVLRNLPLVPRLVIALFLLSVGIGYVSALVQLHFQHASPGNLLPTSKDAENVFSGSQEKPLSKIESLLEADESKPFNGSGQMRAAFTRRSSNWKAAIKAMAKDRGVKADQAEQALRQEREGERLAVLAWIGSGTSTEAYRKDNYPMPVDLADHPLTADYLIQDDQGHATAVRVQSILKDRCFRCHAPDGDDTTAAQYPLNSYGLLKPYIEVKESSGMSLTKLAQTTHVHLLGFSILYGLTGLIFAFSSYPGWMRMVLSPLALLAQLVDIGCWWLARLDRMYADAIVVTGAVVAVALLLQIILSLFSMFDRIGKSVLVLLLLVACVAAYAGKEYVVDPYVSHEKTPAVAEP